MPHDFGSFGSRDRRPAAGSASGIGFHELRQACEISTLREDLERLSHEAGALRGSVEEAVEEIRDRFAALTAQEMTDAAAMAPLLQFAVTTLLDIREQTRRLHTQTGPVADDERSPWLGAADAPRVRPANPPANAVTAPCAPAPRPPRVEAPPVSKTERVLPKPSSEAVEPPAPPMMAPVPPVPVAPPMAASWLASKPSPPSPPPPRASAERGMRAQPAPSGGIDWLGPAGR